MRQLTVGSLFSGIGGFDLGLERAGFKIEFQVEIDPYCQRVLAKHWPNVTRYGDITAMDWTTVQPVDLLCGGFPCQDLSFAGKRAGIDGARSGLWSEYVRAIRHLRPRYVLVENVPGLLSSPRTIGPYRCVCGWTPRRGGMLVSRQNTQEFCCQDRRGHVGQDGAIIASLDAALWGNSAANKTENGEMGASSVLDDYRSTSRRLLKASRSTSQGETRSSKPTHLAIQGCDSEERANQLDGNDGDGAVGERTDQCVESKGSNDCPSCGRNLEDIATQHGSAMGRVLGDLAESGYDAEWRVLSAAQYGAPHLRERVWLLAYPTSQLWNGMSTHGIWGDGCSGEKWKSRRQDFGILPLGSRWESYQPSICRTDDGLSSRLDRMKSLGNAIVPQIAEALGRMILASGRGA